MATLSLLAAALACGALGLLALAGWLRLSARSRVAADNVNAATVRLSEARRMLRQKRNVGTAQNLAETAFDGTTRTVQDIHRGIAKIPFSVLEANPATRDTSRIVREIHDLTADSVYGSIRGINRLIGSGLRRGLQINEPPVTDKRGDRKKDE